MRKSGNFVTLLCSDFICHEKIIIIWDVGGWCCFIILHVFFFFCRGSHDSGLGKEKKMCNFLVFRLLPVKKKICVLGEFSVFSVCILLSSSHGSGSGKRGKRV